MINSYLPKLKSVDPMIASTVVIFAVLNLFLGLALYSQVARTNDFFIITPIFNYHFWGTVFFANGLALAISYLMNSWAVMRFCLVWGLTLKFFWLIALATRQIQEHGSNLFLLIFFASLAAFQFVAYLYFPDHRKANLWASKRQ